MTHRIADIAIERRQDAQRNDDDGYQNDAQIETQFFIAPHAAEGAQKNQIIEAKIDAKEDHEDRDHPLQIGAVGHDAVVFDSKAACACGAEGQRDGIEDWHAAPQQEDDFQYRHAGVDQIEDARGLHGARHQLAYLRAGGFGAHDEHGVALAAGIGRDCQQENQHAHAANPVGEGAPVQNAVGQGFYLAEDAGAGCGKAGDGFKQAVDIAFDAARQIKGQRAYRREDDPHQRGNDKAFARIEGGFLRLEDIGGKADKQHEQNGYGKGQHGGIFMAAHGDDQRRQHQQGHNAQRDGKHAHDHSVIHTASL